MINHQKLPLTDEKRRLILVSILRIDYPEEVERIKGDNETKKEYELNSAQKALEEWKFDH